MPVDRSSYPVRVIRPGDPKPEPAPRPTPAEALAMMWPLALESWLFMGKPVEGRMRRDVVRVFKNGTWDREADEA